MEMCTGSGVVPLILYHNFSPRTITGIDFNRRAADLAARSVQLNGLSDVIDIVCADVMDAGSLFCAESFDAVTCNPPYMEKGRGVASEEDARHAARHETTAALADFCRAAGRLLKRGGTFTIVHRPSRLADIFECCRSAGLEPKRMRLVAPHAADPANTVLIQAVKGAGKELRTDPLLVVRDGAGGFSPEIMRIYERSSD
jgi:tRNA1Val (adenine37-N6)-methyltransferase